MDDRLDSPVVVFRPSYSATTLGCPGSLRPSMAIPDTAGYDAAVGTVFHELIATWQKTHVAPYELLGQTRTITKPQTGEQFHVVVDEDMFTYGQECLDRYMHIPGERFVEVRVDISSLTPIPNQTGTSDLIICSPYTLDVIDWKYGKGVRVFAENNTQGLCYAWGAFQKYDHIYNFRKIRIHIGQPRLGHFDMWEIDRDQLYEFADWARGRWARAWSGEGELTPSPHACQWCRAKTRCTAHQALLEAIVDESFDILDEVSLSPAEQQEVVVADNPQIALVRPVELSTERLAWIYRYRKQLEAWLAAIGEELLHRGLRGDDLGGLWKVGPGRMGDRKWVDEETTAKALVRLGIAEEQLWSRELVSPPRVESLLRTVGVKGRLNKEYVAAFTTRAAGKPTLMPVTDDRNGMHEIVDQSFTEEGDV